MIKSLNHSAEQRYMILVYIAKSEEDFIYRDVCNEAESFGLRVQYANGSFEAAGLSQSIADIKQQDCKPLGMHVLLVCELQAILHRKHAVLRSRISPNPRYGS